MATERDEQADGACRAPAHVGGLRDRVDEQREARGDCQRSADVVPAARRLDAALGDERNREREYRGADRHVDEEDPLPAEILGEDAAHEDADRGAAPAHSSPDAECLVSLGSLGEERRHDGERRRRDDRGAEALHRSRTDQDALAVRKAADERGEREERDPDHEHTPTAEVVGCAPAEEEEAAEGDRVGADHPLQVLLEKSSASPIEGSATFTIETSRIVMKKATQTSARAFHRRGSGAAVTMAPETYRFKWLFPGCPAA